MNTGKGFAHSFLVAAIAIAAITTVMQVRAQAAPGETASQSSQPRSLFITVIEGEGALNDIRTRAAREPIVEVDDENHKPVAGALVLFSLDKSGSSFANFSGISSVSVQTNAAGHAAATGFQITQRKGTYNIHVQAKYGGLTAEGVIAESNLAVSSSGGAAPSAVSAFSHKKLWIVSSVLVAGAVAGIVIATRSSSPTTISTGTGTVGAPASVSRGGLRFQLHLPQR